MIRQGSANYLGPPRTHPPTPRFYNQTVSRTKTHQPYWSSGESLCSYNSTKALTAMEYERTLPSSTTSFGRLKSEASVSHRQFDKENLRSVQNCQASLSMQQNDCVRDVNQIAAEFKNIISQFEGRREELERSVATFGRQDSCKDFYPVDSCFVIKECSEENNVSTATDYYPKDTHPQSMLRDQPDRPESARDFLQGMVFPAKSSALGPNRNSNGLPYFIIDLRLPDRVQKLVYIPTVSPTRYAQHVVSKFNINAGYARQIATIIEQHIRRVNSD